MQRRSNGHHHTLFKRITAHILCFALIWTTIVPAYAAPNVAPSMADEKALLAANPNAQIIRISEADYPQLAARLRERGYQPAGVQLAQNDSYTPDSRRSSAPYEQRRYDYGCNGSEPPVEEDASVHLGINLTNHNHGGYGGGSKEEAMVLFIIIGAVVMVVWTLYAFKYLYDVAAGYNPCRLSEFGLSASTIEGDTLQHAYFNGIHYKGLIQDGNTEFGFSAEAGHADIALVENGTLHLNGLYWFLGPLLRWRLSSGPNPHYFQMQFVAGSTEHSEMGLMAKADLGVQLGITDTFSLGLNWGALNINLHENQGTITQREQYYYIYGINAGFRF